MMVGTRIQGETSKKCVSHNKKIQEESEDEGGPILF